MSDEPRPTPRPRPSASDEAVPAAVRRTPARPPRPRPADPQAAPAPAPKAPRPTDSSRSARPQTPTSPRAGGGRPRSSGPRRRTSASSTAGQLTEVQVDALKRAGLIIAIGCVAIIAGVGIFLAQPLAALGGCIAWIAAMVWTFRKDHIGGAGR